MAVDNAPPLVVIGMEGLWGTLIMLVIFPIAAALPGRDLGSIENTQDSFFMVSQSNAIQVLPAVVPPPPVFLSLFMCTARDAFCLPSSQVKAAVVCV